MHATAAQVTITRLDPSDPTALYCHYSGELQPQDCYVSLDLEDGELAADYNGEIGNAIPESVFHRRTLRWGIPLLTTDAANALLEELQPLAQRVLNGAEIDWDGNNFLGGLDVDAAAAAEEITQRCDPSAAWDEEDLVSEMGASDWFVDGTPEEITAETTDAELERLADEIAREARADARGELILWGLQECLEGMRDERREEAHDEVARQLNEVDETLTQGRERRDALVRRAARIGMSLREIAAYAGLSHTQVSNILKADRQVRVTEDGHVYMTNVDGPIGHVGQDRSDIGDPCWIADVREKSDDPAGADRWSTYPGPVNSRNGVPSFATKDEAVEAIARLWR